MNAELKLSRRRFLCLATGFACLAIAHAAFADAPRPRGKIALVRGNFGNSARRKIWIVMSDGSGLRPLTDDNDNPGEDSPAWSPDGGRIAFSAIRNGNRRIYIRESNGKNELCLTPDAAVAAAYEQPAWSPDGKMLAFCGWPADRKSSQIFVMRSDGKDMRQLTVGSGYNWHPCFSPGGQHVAFETTRDGNREIYLMDADGSNPTNLSKHGGTDHRPAISPDGRHIAFMTGRDFGSAEICVMDADGTNLINLTKHPARDSEPTWSPDGYWLAFTRINEQSERGPMDIFIMQADGSEVVNLTRSPVGEDNWAPSWGRD